MFKNLINKNQLTIDFICGFYILFLSSYVKDITEAVVYGWKSTANASILGIILLLMTVLEAYAISTKINIVLQNIENEEDKHKLTTPIILLLFLNAAITLMSIVLAFNTFGYNHEKYPLVIYFAVFLLILKAIYFIKKISLSDKNKIQLSSNKNLFLNIVIALYSCLIFTMFWTANKTDGHVYVNNIPMFFIYLIPMVIFFSFLYFPLRIPFLLEKIARTETMQEKLAFYISFLIALVPTLYRAFV